MDDKLSYHESLTLQNFTAFTDVTLDFVHGINVFIGENGTGKTHLMKAMYAWQMSRHLADLNGHINYGQMFSDTFGARSAGELQRSNRRVAVAKGKIGANDWSIGIRGDVVTFGGHSPKPNRPVFIPAIEMMAHARNMAGVLRDYADFDRTCFDFVNMVTAKRQNDRDPRYSLEMDELEGLIPGQVDWNEDQQRFYLTQKGVTLAFPLLAEGLRKVSSLDRLVKLNWIRRGGVLFWDEPEVNLNPKWMDEVVEALVHLARQKVQIFLATHNYVILKEIDLVLRKQNKGDDADVQARFFSLHKLREATKVTWNEDFAAVPNAILDQYDIMLNEDLRLQDSNLRRTENGAHQ